MFNYVSKAWTIWTYCKNVVDSFVRVVSIHFDSEFDAIILQAKKFFENFHNSLVSCIRRQANWFGVSLVLVHRCLIWFQLVFIFFYLLDSNRISMDLQSRKINIYLTITHTYANTRDLSRFDQCVYIFRNAYRELYLHP